MTANCRYYRVFAFASLALFLMLFGAAQAAEFAVRNAQFRVTNGVVNMDADIDFPLSDAAREALGNGVTLTVVIESKVKIRRSYLWDDTVATISARYGIEYHALSSQYMLSNVNLGITQSFSSLTALRADLGRVRNFPLLGVSQLAPTDRYSVHVQARLDIESLPAPLRPLAYLSTRWRISSDWYHWNLDL